MASTHLISICGIRNVVGVHVAAEDRAQDLFHQVVAVSNVLYQAGGDLRPHSSKTVRTESTTHYTPTERTCLTKVTLAWM